MRRLVGTALGLMLFAVPVPGWTDDIYHWVDRAGNVHYSNTSGGAGASSDSMPSEPEATTGEAGDGGDAAAGDVASAPAAADAADAFSSSASLRRYALERDLRATDGQIRELDSRLAILARARAQNQQGSAATGGVATAADVRSEEEKTIAAQRDELTKHKDEVRADYGKLRDEVTSRLGTLPEWWIEVR